MRIANDRAAREPRSSGERSPLIHPSSAALPVKRANQLEVRRWSKQPVREESTSVLVHVAQNHELHVLAVEISHRRLIIRPWKFNQCVSGVVRNSGATVHDPDA